MSKSIVRAACGLLILLVVIAGLAACSNKIPEPEYASQMTESALESMNNCDYEAYLEDFTPGAHDAVNEEDFNTGCQEIKALIGDYIDKEFQKAETQDSYVVVYYIANYSDEPDDVEITVYFQEIEEEIYIAGLGLSSPKIKASLESGGE